MLHSHQSSPNDEFSHHPNDVIHCNESRLKGTPCHIVTSSQSFPSEAGQEFYQFLQTFRYLQHFHCKTHNGYGDISPNTKDVSLRRAKSGDEKESTKEQNAEIFSALNKVVDWHSYITIPGTLLQAKTHNSGHTESLHIIFGNHFHTGSSYYMNSGQGYSNYSH